MTYEEELLNGIILKLQKHMDTSLLSIVQTTIIEELQRYKVDIKNNELVVYNQCNDYYLQLFLSVKKLEGKSIKTINRYKDFIIKLFDFFPDKKLQDYTANDLRYFLAKYQAKGNCTNTTMDGIRKIYCSFFNWLDKEEHIEKSPARKLAIIKHDSKPRNPYTEGEMEGMMLATESIRDKTIMDFLRSTGCRVSEVSEIKNSDVDFDKKTVTIHGKGNKYRTVYLQDKTMFYLKLYQNYKKKNNIDSDMLFVTKKPYHAMSSGSIRNVIKKCSDIAGVPNAYPHRYRSTCITTFLRRGMKIENARVIFGHTNINTTNGYYLYDDKTIQNEFYKYG